MFKAEKNFHCLYISYKILSFYFFSVNINNKLLRRCSPLYPTKSFPAKAYLPPGSILLQYLLEFENHNIQFPAFSLNMQTIQQLQNKDSFIAIKKVLNRIQTCWWFNFSYSWETLQCWKVISMLAQFDLRNSLSLISVHQISILKVLDFPFFLPYRRDKFHPHSGPLNWVPRVASGSEKQIAMFDPASSCLSSDIMSKCIYCWHKQAHFFLEASLVLFLTSSWYKQNLA